MRQHIKQHFDKSSQNPAERIVVGCFPRAAVDGEFDQAEVALHFFQHIFIRSGHDRRIILEGSAAKGSEHDGMHTPNHLWSLRTLWPPHQRNSSRISSHGLSGLRVRVLMIRAEALMIAAKVLKIRMLEKIIS